MLVEGASAIRILRRWMIPRPLRVRSDESRVVPTDPCGPLLNLEFARDFCKVSLGCDQHLAPNPA
jgi:hypothetical protein